MPRKKDIVGTVLSYQSIWTPGFPVFVTVEFDTQDQMNGFVKSPDAYINYIDDDGAKPIPWPRTPFLFSATAAPWDVSAPFTTVPPDN